MRDEPFCSWHAPETAEEAAEARRLGGLRRQENKMVAAIYDFRGLRTIEDHQGLLETAATETLLPWSLWGRRAMGPAGRRGALYIET